MIRKWGALLLCLIIIISLFGCGDTNNNGNVGAVPGTNAESKVTTHSGDINEHNETVIGSNNSLTLPDTFPSDFPFPENIVITRIDDDSDEDRYSFGIRFTFDPSLDMDATFEMYDDYAKGLGYNIIIGGEEYFANGIFQFGATSKFTASNMFIVTLKPDGSTYGDIQLKYKKDAN